MSNLEPVSYICKRTDCDHCNIDGTCMYGLSDDLIKCAKSGKPMCSYLRDWVLERAEMLEEDVEDEETFNITDADVGDIAVYLESIEETIDLIRQRLGIVR